MPKPRRTVPSRRRMRTLKAEFWTDPEIAQFSYRCRLTFAGLICAYADDYGRELDDLRSIKAAIWLHDDDVTVDEIAEDLTTLNVAGRIVRYDDATSGQRGLRRQPAAKHMKTGARYVAIVNWKKHQRVDHPTPSKYPAPPASSRMTREQSRLFPESLAPDLEVEVEVGSGIGSGKGEGRPAENNGAPPPHDDSSIQRRRPTPQRIVEIWNETCPPDLPAVRELTDGRRSHITTRSRDSRDETWWREYFTAIATTPFCTGENDRGWRANFDWAVRSEDIVAKVREGNYRNGAGRSGTMSQASRNALELAGDMQGQQR